MKAFNRSIKAATSKGGQTTQPKSQPTKTIVDNRASTVLQRKLQQEINSSPRVLQAKFGKSLPAKLEMHQKQNGVMQRMTLKRFEDMVDQRYQASNSLIERFMTYFIEDYQETEDKGGFLTDGIMYDNDWRNYVQDEAFDEKILTNNFIDFEGTLESEEKHLIAMRNPPGGKFAWGHPVMIARQSQMEDRKPFRNWLDDKLDNPEVCNCWEAVLLAAFNAGIVNKQYIKDAISLEKNTSPVEPESFESSYKFVSAIKKNHEGYSKRGEDGEMPLVGETIKIGRIVLFGENGEHVALATGNNEVLELDKGTDGIVKTPIKEVMSRNLAYRKAIYWECSMKCVISLDLQVWFDSFAKQNGQLLYR